MSPVLEWLPPEPLFDARLASLKLLADPADAWHEVVSLAGTRHDFLQAARLDRVLQKLPRSASGPLQPVRVALLASSTTQHLLASPRIAALRRGLLLDMYITPYGQYFQELLDPHSALAAFRPEVCCFLLDGHHLADLAQTGAHHALEHLTHCWQLCRERFSAAVIQQDAMPVFEALAGSNEHRFPSSPAARLAGLNQALPAAVDAQGVALLNASSIAVTCGLDNLHDPALWYHAKQEVHPAAAPLYADYLVRILAALRGHSGKCLVLDLDNTLWGGVIGDDGVDGIELGQGTAAGEAYLAFQRYCLALKSRGIALAVCSKNDEANARIAFREHPSMLLREDDFACFVANWQDKATNLREIARLLNLGLESLVFADDNPAERALVRQELPEVFVPELPSDPAHFVRCLARSGCFETVSCTSEDLTRAAQYRANAEREHSRAQTTDLRAYLAGLEMQAHIRPFDEAGLPRIVQLINKTNQFNLTTPRVSEAQVRDWMADPGMLAWQVRLTDRFGDNGVVGLVALRLEGREAALTLLLLSCRVLGRGLEEEMIHVAAAAAREHGALRLTGLYVPTAKNSLVRGLLQSFGFSPAAENPDGSFSSTLDLAGFTPRTTEITVHHQRANRRLAQQPLIN